MSVLLNVAARPVLLSARRSQHRGVLDQPDQPPLPSETTYLSRLATSHQDVVVRDFVQWAQCRRSSLPAPGRWLSERARHFLPVGSELSSRRETSPEAAKASNNHLHGDENDDFGCFSRSELSPLGDFVQWDDQTDDNSEIISERRQRVLTEEFRDISFIGRGGFGSVVRATSRVDGCEYAVKIVDIPKGGTEAMGRTFGEARTMASISPHPRIVRYFGSWIGASICGLEDMFPPLFAEGGAETRESSSFEGKSYSFSGGSFSGASTEALFIQMALCGEGGTLADQLCIRSVQLAGDLQRRFSTALQIFDDIASGVEHMHNEGFCHLDLSPKNIFCQGGGAVNDGERWLVGDFSLSRQLSFSLNPGEVIGTFLYAAPEVFDGCLPSATPSTSGAILDGGAADVYSLGVILSELMLSFSTGMERAVTLEGLRSSGAANLGHPVLDRLVSRMISADPRRRPTVSQVRVALKANRAAFAVQQNKVSAAEDPLADRQLAGDLSVARVRLSALHSCGAVKSAVPLINELRKWRKLLDDPTIQDLIAEEALPYAEVQEGGL